MTEDFWEDTKPTLIWGPLQADSILDHALVMSEEHHTDLIEPHDLGENGRTQYLTGAPAEIPMEHL